MTTDEFKEWLRQAAEASKAPYICSGDGNPCEYQKDADGVFPCATCKRNTMQTPKNSEV